jgi:mRNA interferase MazF
LKQISRYEIFLANLNPSIGSEIEKTRPVVVVSQNEMNKYLETIVICPLTTSIHPKWRSRIPTTCENKPAEIAVDQIRTISKKRLIKKIDSLNQIDAKKVRQLITEMYGE